MGFFRKNVDWKKKNSCYKAIVIALNNTSTVSLQSFLMITNSNWMLSVHIKSIKFQSTCSIFTITTQCYWKHPRGLLWLYFILFFNSLFLIIILRFLLSELNRVINVEFYSKGYEQHLRCRISFDPSLCTLIKKSNAQW